MGRVEQVNYLSAGVRCAADLYLPDVADDGPVPGIVCGESGVKVKEMIAPVANYLVDAGFAVMAIDYRSVGASEGRPRGQLFPEQQVDDVRSAVSYLRTRHEVDPERIGLWGNSVAGPVMVQAAVLDRRVRCVVAQSPSLFDGWRATEKIAGSLHFSALRAMLEQDRERRDETGEGASIPWLRFGDAGDQVSQSYLDLGESYPTFRNEIVLESQEYLLRWAPVHFIDRLAPTPLLIVANGGSDPYHELDETQAAYARAGEPKRLDILPFDAMGFYSEPGTGEATSRAIGWFDEHLRRATLPTRSAPAGAEAST
ncbi:MAG: alpha/beta fold hydrolase [Umezawaea sp.]